jgi:hypothetical protein
MTSALEALQEQRARLVLALGNTSRVTEFEDRRTERFSPDELLTAIAGLDQQIQAMSGQRENRVFTVASSSGLYGDSCSGGDPCGADSYERWR